MTGAPEHPSTGATEHPSTRAPEHRSTGAPGEGVIRPLQFMMRRCRSHSRRAIVARIYAWPMQPPSR
jgi:hypothetical protein